MMEELKNNELQDAQQEEAYKSGSVQCIDSREVAKMVEKEHRNLKRDIRKYNTELDALNFEHTDFFIKSTYVDSSGRKQENYLVTKKGCEFIAHKLTGIKGTKFTATYINRFHEMEDTLDIQIVPILKQFLERQDKLEKMVLEKMNSKKIFVDDIEEQDYVPFPIVGDGSPEISLRKKLLNGRISEMARVCGWARNFALHRLYRTLEDVLEISLDDYVDAYRRETHGGHVTTMEAVVAYDRLYDTAIKLCDNTIEQYL